MPPVASSSFESSSNPGALRFPCFFGVSVGAFWPWRSSWGLTRSWPEEPGSLVLVRDGGRGGL